MTEKIGVITDAEWEIMRMVWSLGQVNSSHLIKLVQQKRDWQASTIKTLLGRLVKKDYLIATKEGRRFTYTANIAEEEAMNHATQSLFNQLCSMKKGRTLATLMEQTALSQNDIQMLQKVLAAKLPDAPTMIECDCLPTNCDCLKEEAK
ncbi:CopY/TcrY family copper transport repressor [Latilactobacillus fragifolii]|uniref:CopY/TcrY family copper transport repressor n=1 Tax=Latilactobacillus fragifolii TaxID=2814244 RepID=UPI001ABAD715|nr:CopY/TcrY family copper transport repressor [Latilactobacillus fragifolii]